MKDLNQRPSQSINGKKITSLEIAEFTGKRHDNLLRDIRKMIPAWEKLGLLKFEECYYVNENSREMPMYNLTKDQSLFVTSKFDDEIRAKLVVRWLELEKQAALGQYQKPYGVRLYEHELPLFRILDRYLVRGDIKAVADDLGITRGWVGKVKRGIGRSVRVMEALLKKAHFNKLHGITEGYKSFFATKQLSLFENEGI